MFPLAATLHAPPSVTHLLSVSRLRLRLCSFQEDQYMTLDVMYPGIESDLDRRSVLKEEAVRALYGQHRRRRTGPRSPDDGQAGGAGRNRWLGWHLARGLPRLPGPTWYADL